MPRGHAAPPGELVHPPASNGPDLDPSRPVTHCPASPALPGAHFTDRRRMNDHDVRKTAEAALRELPGVVGAFVHPDAFGNPREIHLLIRPGPQTREFAHHVQSVLESRLRIPIDRRIISIAQLADERSLEDAAASREQAASPDEHGDRYRLLGIESEVSDRRVTVRLRLLYEGGEVTGEATEIEARDGRARAAALAALDAVNGISGERARFGLDFATIVEAVGYEYALASVAVTSPLLGRRAVSLSGANRILDEDTETAAALAVLKATNRTLAFIMDDRDQRLRFRPRQR